MINPRTGLKINFTRIIAHQLLFKGPQSRAQIVSWFDSHSVQHLKWGNSDSKEWFAELEGKGIISSNRTHRPTLYTFEKPPTITLSESAVLGLFKTDSSIGIELMLNDILATLGDMWIPTSYSNAMDAGTINELTYPIDPYPGAFAHASKLNTLIARLVEKGLIVQSLDSSLRLSPETR
jgi:hypothetical protein